MNRITTTGTLGRRTLASALPFLGLTAAALVPGTGAAQAPSSVLPSWNDGPAKQAILDFVHATTDRSSKDFVPPDDRIATFDQDGTLWVEHPNYTQAMFALDRMHAMAPEHPEWKSHEPFKSVLANDKAAMAHFSEQEWAEIVFVTHAGMSQAAFLEIATQWQASAKHPRFNRPYTELVYQPMIELLTYLRANQFETFIVSGGGQDFIRPYSQRIYGIPTQKVIGSSIATKFVLQDNKAELMRLPKLFFNDNYDGKAIGIDRVIGKRPYASIGNSTGDQEMLEYTGAGEGARLKMLVYHDDATREFAYGPAGGLPDTSVGTFTQALMDEAKARAWTVISMKNDWQRVFAFE